jgi:hypothetical protein
VVNLGTMEQQVTSTKLTVAGEDITDLALYTTSGYRATGHIVFDPAPPQTGVTPSSLMLAATPASPFEITGGIGRATVNDDWTFEAKGLAGSRLFRIAQGLPAGWMLQSVVHGQTDVTDKPLDISQDVEGIVITVTNRPARLAGSVVDAKGRPSSDCTIVVFAEDTALRPPASTRFLRALRPDAEGKFKAEQLPAAAYLVVAVESLETGDENDPELLEALEAVATRVTLSWGEASEVPLKVSKIDGR